MFLLGCYQTLSKNTLIPASLDGESAGAVASNGPETAIPVYWLEPLMGGEVPVSAGSTRRASQPLSPIQANEKKNAQVEDTFGREEALQEDWHRQNQAGTDEEASHPYLEGA
jgi:hypothetical protein